MSKVVTFGEIMLRLAPNGYYRLLQNDQLQATFGGGEANVAVSLANLGVDATFVTKLPNNAIAQAAVSCLRSFNVDTSHIVYGGQRMGTSLKKVQASVEVYVFTTEAIHLFKKQQLMILIGKMFFLMQSGSILQELRLLWEIIWSIFASKLALRLKKEEFEYLAI